MIKFSGKACREREGQGKKRAWGTFWCWWWDRGMGHTREQWFSLGKWGQNQSIMSSPGWGDGISSAGQMFHSQLKSYKEYNRTWLCHDRNSVKTCCYWNQKPTSRGLSSPTVLSSGLWQCCLLWFVDASWSKTTCGYSCCCSLKLGKFPRFLIYSPGHEQSSAR